MRCNLLPVGLVCLSLVACRTHAKFDGRPDDKDLRLQYEGKGELDADIRDQRCTILSGSRRTKAGSVPVGGGLSFGELVTRLDSSFVHDSPAVLVKGDSETQRPGWYEPHAERRREEFDRRLIEPGDIVWFPPLE
jgi:hypothetical protein